MAENKKGFLLYADLIHTMKYLTDEQRGLIFLWVLQYVNDMNPEPLEGLLQAVIEPIRQQLKRDLEKYENQKEGFSNSGKMGNLKRWNNDLYLKVINKSISLEEAEKIASGRKASPPDKKASPPIAKIAVKDNVNVNVNDIVKVKDNNKLKSKVYSKEVNDCFNICLKFFPVHLHPKKNETWLDTIDKLNRLDNIPFESIQQITQQAREDSFWSSNFLSLTKLRTKNKDNIKFIVVFNEKFNNNKKTITNERLSQYTTTIREQYPNL